MDGLQYIVPKYQWNLSLSYSYTFTLTDELETGTHK